MDSKKRLAIAIAITCLIVAAIFASFGRSLFFVQIPSITLADVNEGGDASGSSGVQDGDQYWQVAVTPETVQSIVATLSRPDSYYRELTVETLWSGGSYASPVQYWEDGGWAHTRQVLASGAVRHDLTGPETAYYWYEGSTAWGTFPADERSSDLAQHIPTYETVVDLPPEEITAAGYELRGELPCIFVELQPEDSPLVYQYWVSVDSGLLVSAETLEDGELVYRMTAYSPVQAPCPADAQFRLPDGTVLHTVGEAREGG